MIEDEVTERLRKCVTQWRTIFGLTDAEAAQLICDDQIDILISEHDEGQYHAIQKGFDVADGEIMAWLNGDDIYHPWTLSIVEEIEPSLMPPHFASLLELT